MRVRYLVVCAIGMMIDDDDDDDGTMPRCTRMCREQSLSSFF